VDRAAWLGSMVDRGNADKIACRCLASVQRVGEPNEAVPEGCSLEHERRRRGGAMAKKTGGGLSSLRGRRKARGSWEGGGEGR
jgi:hypothetical protein